MTLVVAAYLAIARTWRTLALVLVSVVGGQILSTVLRNSFERASPDLIPGAPEVFRVGFPSGH